MAAVLPDPFYYLQNFRRVLAWLATHHADLLDADEHAFLATFSALPQNAQALLVRMVMRKGDCFRLGKLDYAEIGDTRTALAPLVAVALVDAAPLLSPEELAALLKKDELARVLGAKASARKDELIEQLLEAYDEARPLRDWCAEFDDEIFRLSDAARYDRFRLLFFGNLHQDWSEFVLADLGLLKYETVALTPEARAFRHRADVDDYLALADLRERLEEGEDPATLAPDIPATPHDNPWLERRRARLLFALGQAQEREGETDTAIITYAQSAWPEARIRRLRLLEKTGRCDEALALAEAALAAPHGEEETQQLLRLLPRLQGKLGLPKMPRVTPPDIERIDLVLPPQDDLPVELLAAEHLAAPDAPVFYVENALVNSLFGLLCWEAVFAPVPGAFFHPFQYGPADLHAPDFHERRADEFARCLALLDSGAHRAAILATWREKYGTQSPFVFWDALDEELLSLALDCIPPAHLRALFTRLLADLRANRSGFPDLVQFWPRERRYRMVEVKGPGDRVQDNQQRWLAHAVQHGIPVAVCFVRWPEGE
jgi:tetratricopeptide (TPR) repeat protein